MADSNLDPGMIGRHIAWRQEQERVIAAKQEAILDKDHLLIEMLLASIPQGYRKFFAGRQSIIFELTKRGKATYTAYDPPIETSDDTKPTRFEREFADLVVAWQGIVDISFELKEDSRGCWHPSVTFRAI